MLNSTNMTHPSFRAKVMDAIRRTSPSPGTVSHRVVRNRKGNVILMVIRQGSAFKYVCHTTNRDVTQTLYKAWRAL